MDKVVDIETDPKRVEEVDDEKTIERLEKQKQRCKKIAKKCAKISAFIFTAFGMTGLCVGGIGGAGAGGMAGLVVSVPTITAACVAYKRYSKTKERLDKLRKKVDPDSYYQGVIEEEKELLHKYERNAKKQFDSDQLGRDDLGEIVAEAKENLPKQRKRTKVLEEAHSIAKQRGKAQTVRRLTDIMRDTKGIMFKEFHQLMAVGGLGAGGIMAGGTIFDPSVQPLAGAAFATALFTVGAIGLYRAKKASAKEKAIERSEALLKKFVKYNKSEKA